MTLGLPDGSLHCADNCTFDVTYCGVPLCGNGVVDFSEQCDGDIILFDCEDLGLDGDTTCDPVTCEVDTSMCI